MAKAGRCPPSFSLCDASALCNGGASTHTVRRAQRIALLARGAKLLLDGPDAMVLVAALVTLAAAASAAAGADDVAAATINADRSPETLLGDDAPLFGSTPELGDRRTLAKKGGCNPKKNTSCCRTPRRTPPRAAPPATHPRSEDLPC